MSQSYGFRKELGDTAYPGVIQRYSVKQGGTWTEKRTSALGWGLIKPESLATLPKEARKKIQEAETAAEENGKEAGEVESCSGCC